MEIFKKILLVFLLLGILLGPVYLAYCNFFSGKLAGHFLVYERDLSVAGTNGARVIRAGEVTSNRPALLSLSPAMNPVSILISAQYVPPAVGRKSARFDAVLMKDGQNVWQEELTISGSKKEKENIEIGSVRLPAVNKVVKTFSVTQPGEYYLTVRELDAADLAVQKIKAKVRKNVLEADRGIYGSGFGLLGFGILGIIFTSKKGDKFIINSETKQ